MGWSVNQLATINKGRVLDTLRGRPLSLPMIRLLVERLGISADVPTRQAVDSTAHRSRSREIEGTVMEAASSPPRRA